MANIKISELNELETRHDEDLLAIVDTNNNETKKIKVETLAPENFELYAIADTQPTIPVGESYYNTKSNKIFTNVGGVYVDKGKPKTGILYIIFSDKATYAYNGTTLVSVGGGSGETITQQPTAPENPEENDLWIDTTNGNALKRYNGTSWELVSTSSDAPIGTITPFAGTTPPSDYLLCDGTAVSRTTYSDLFAVIGTTYGSGDGSTTFNLPNLKGRVPVGLDGTQTEFDTLGETGGSKTHKHLLPLGADGNSIYANTTEQTTSLSVSAGKYTNWSGVTGTSINAISSKEASNLQPYIVVNYIIKATKTTPIQAEVVNTFSNSTKDAYSCDYSNKAFGGTILWTNPNPTSAFAEQTINLDMSDYNYIEIYYRFYTGATGEQIATKIPVGSSAKFINEVWLEGIGETIAMRTVHTSSNNIVVTNTSVVALSDGTLRTTNLANGTMIPTKVIGYK